MILGSIPTIQTSNDDPSFNKDPGGSTVLFLYTYTNDWTPLCMDIYKYINCRYRYNSIWIQVPLQRLILDDGVPNKIGGNDQIDI